MQLYCARSRFSKCWPFEHTSIELGHAFQNSSHLNPPLLHQVMLFKMPAISMQLYCSTARERYYWSTLVVQQAQIQETVGRCGEHCQQE
jgi:hypothetical protein